jgi:protein TonB
METRIFNKSWCNLIFAGRNREYGAYVLRMKYEKNMAVSLLCMAVLPAGLGLFLLNPATIEIPHDVPMKDTVSIISVIFPDLPDEPGTYDKTRVVTHAVSEQIKFVRDTVFNEQKTEAKIADHPSLNPDTASLNAHAGPDNKTSHPAIPDVLPEKKEASVYSPASLDVWPAFPGGDEGMYAFLSQHMNYPDQAIKAEISGKVFVSFVVNDKGNIERVHVKRGIGGGCDEEAMRVIKMMPAWKPGRLKGNNVSTIFVLPVNFSIK